MTRTVHTTQTLHILLPFNWGSRTYTYGTSNLCRVGSHCTWDMLPMGIVRGGAACIPAHPLHCMHTSLSIACSGSSCRTQECGGERSDRDWTERSPVGPSPRDRLGTTGTCHMSRHVVRCASCTSCICAVPSAYTSLLMATCIVWSIRPAFCCHVTRCCARAA